MAKASVQNSNQSSGFVACFNNIMIRPQYVIILLKVKRNLNTYIATCNFEHRSFENHSIATSDKVEGLSGVFCVMRS